MKIAQVAPLFESVPPSGYGGTERVVCYLTDALVAMGHEVTLYASGDSVTLARLVPVVDRSLRLDPRRPEWLVWHTMMLDRVFKAARSFDVIHFHVDFLHFRLQRYENNVGIEVTCKGKATSTSSWRSEIATTRWHQRCSFMCEFMKQQATFPA